MRENQRIYGSKITLGDLINLSQNQSFTRTLNTSMNTFFSMVVVVVISIIFNSGLPYASFALPMMIGIISGCYSTLVYCMPALGYVETQGGGRNKPVADTKSAKKKGWSCKAGSNRREAGDCRSCSFRTANSSETAEIPRKRRRKRNSILKSGLSKSRSFYIVYF